jgi:hypothetical protein
MTATGWKPENGQRQKQEKEHLARQRSGPTETDCCGQIETGRGMVDRVARPQHSQAVLGAVKPIEDKVHKHEQPEQCENVARRYVEQPKLVSQIERKGEQQRRHWPHQLIAECGRD